MTERVAAIVVTHNRRALLSACLSQLQAQTLSADGVFVVDNASTDGTETYLKTLKSPSLTIIRLAENVGGAGGFASGLQAAFQDGFDWFWLMDDDALPESDALEKLLESANNPANIYASIAISQNAPENHLCWPATAVRPNGPHYLHKADELEDIENVQGVPFLGFLIHRDMVNRIGYPDASFFISGDDMEYCERAHRNGVEIYLVKASRLRHPLPERKVFRMGRKSLPLLLLPPWKRYYDVRNRILIARRHYGFRLWSETLPGIMIRWLALLLETFDFRQCKAFGLGIFDGLLGRTGKRWLPPGHG